MALIDVELDEARESSVWSIIEAVEAKVIKQALKAKKPYFKVRYRRFKKLPESHRKDVLDRFGSKLINGGEYGHPGLKVKMRGLHKKVYFRAELQSHPA